MRASDLARDDLHGWKFSNLNAVERLVVDPEGAEWIIDHSNEENLLGIPLKELRVLCSDEIDAIYLTSELRIIKLL